MSSDWCKGDLVRTKRSNEYPATANGSSSLYATVTEDDCGWVTWYERDEKEVYHAAMSYGLIKIGMGEIGIVVGDGGGDMMKVLFPSARRPVVILCHLLVLLSRVAAGPG